MDWFGFGKGKTQNNYNNKTNKNKNATRKWRPMNCSPAIKKHAFSKGSCLTHKVLQRLKTEYNKDHPENPIRASENDAIWHELKNRLTDCEKEDCWLKLIDDTVMRKKIDEYIFAPDHPPDWNENPTEWLSNFDILEVLLQYEEAHPNFKFIGPSPIDWNYKPAKKSGKCVTQEMCDFDLGALKKQGKTKIGIVFNLDKHNESGSHWVSLFIDLENPFILFFDSAGDIIPDEILQFINEKVVPQGKAYGIPFLPFKIDRNPKEHQYENTECGMYSLYFLIAMLTGETGKTNSRGMPVILRTPREKIAFFRGKRIPDKFVFDYRKKYFNDG
jgi:hypothetical protein